MHTPAPKPTPPEFGRRLVLVREARGVTSQAEAARLLGVKPERYGAWEKGKSFPRAVELVRLAALFGVTTDWLMTGHEAGLSREAWAMLTEDRPAPTPRRGRRPKLSERQRPT
jgi:transcriptional regulator with XRE-family HTH domain